jgi:hypothetical protein
MIFTTLNPLPHGGRTFWPITYLYGICSTSAEDKVSSKIRYSSSWILGLFWNQNCTYLGPNLPVINFLVNHSKIGGYRCPPPWYYSLLVKCYKIENSLTAQAFLAQQICRQSGESIYCVGKEARVIYKIKNLVKCEKLIGNSTKIFGLSSTKFTSKMYSCL